MKILDLVLKHKYYKMYEDGIKTEEYREITPYWCNRLIGETPMGVDFWTRLLNKERLEYSSPNYWWRYNIRDYTHVRFHDGYTSTTLLYEIKDITVGKGNPNWGAPDHETFIIKLGKRIKTK